jgi:phosphoribosylglycinamide formyltransferase-1
MKIGAPAQGESLALFAYDFPHRKTSAFLRELKFLGYEQIIVIAAPKLPIHGDSEKYFEAFTLETESSEDTKIICDRLGYPYYSCAHDDTAMIEKVIHQYGINLALISGARIIKKDVIMLFKEGIINFHPGKVPETSGLDSFFYTIQKNIPAGVTVHYIDERVDAGNQWCFEPVRLSLEDTPGAVVEKLFWLQSTLLRKFLRQRQKQGIECTEIIRPKKNSPMGALEKYRCLKAFPRWLSNQVYLQT